MTSVVEYTKNDIVLMYMSIYKVKILRHGLHMHKLITTICVHICSLYSLFSYVCNGLAGGITEAYFV